MKKMFVLMMTLVSVIAFSQVAEAKRFGFGKSFGYSKQMKPQQYNQRPAYQSGQRATSPSARPSSGASKWLGPLAGIAAGGLLAAMLFGDGFSGIQPFDILVFILIAMLLMSMLRRRQSFNQMNYARQNDNVSDEVQQSLADWQTRQNMDQPATVASNGSIIGSALSQNAQVLQEQPDWFDHEGFIENAKQHFVMVQNAWDAQDVTEIRAYCTAELTQALEAEMASVDMVGNFTQVDELRAELIETANDGEYFIASVRFSGFIIEERGGFAHAFNEVWHIRRLLVGEGDWQIAGIQQVS